MLRIGCAALALVLLALPAAADQTKSPADAKAYIVSPKDGDTVEKTFVVIFGLKGMGVAPAGVEKEGTGHHHLLINTKLEGDALKEPIIADEKHVHFGKGQTETKVTLPPGKHTLQMMVGDHNHIPHDPPVMSEVITVTVK